MGEEWEGREGVEHGKAIRLSAESPLLVCPLHIQVWQYTCLEMPLGGDGGGLRGHSSPFFAVCICLLILYRYAFLGTHMCALFSSCRKNQ